jgi:hypothetical protein
MASLAPGATEAGWPRWSGNQLATILNANNASATMAHLAFAAAAAVFVAA